MTPNMTPMQILKQNFETFSENLPIQFKDVTLNKAAPKTKTIKLVENDTLSTKTIEKKAVNSDFLKLFQAKTNGVNYSIGFHFTYIDKKEEDFTVACSIKTKILGQEELTRSPEMSIDEFKERINPLNLMMSAKNCSIDDVIQLVSDSLINIEPVVVKKPKMR